MREQKNPATAPAIITQVVDGICHTIEMLDGINNGWAQIVCNTDTFREMYQYTARTFGAEHTCYESALCTMMVCGKHVWIYDGDLNKSTRLTIHKLDIAIQEYLKQESDFESWSLDDYDTILQYALYGALVHI